MFELTPLANLGTTVMILLRQSKTEKLLQRISVHAPHILKGTPSMPTSAPQMNSTDRLSSLFQGSWGQGHQILNSHLLAVHGQELKVPTHRVEGAADTSYTLSPGVLTSSGTSHATGRILRFPEGTIYSEHILFGLSASFAHRFYSRSQTQNSDRGMMSHHLRRSVCLERERDSSVVHSWNLS